MTVNIDEFRARARPASASQDRVRELRAIAQDAPRAAALTGRPEWDWFMRYIEAQIKLAEQTVLEKRNLAATLVLIDEDKAKAAAVQATIWESRAVALRDVILLPKWLIEQGDKALEMIAKLEDEAQNPNR